MKKKNNEPRFESRYGIKKWTTIVAIEKVSLTAENGARSGKYAEPGAHGKIAGMMNFENSQLFEIRWDDGKTSWIGRHFLVRKVAPREPNRKLKS